MLAVLALEAAGDIYAFLGNTSRAAFFNDAHARAVRAVNDLFWNESARAYADWVDVEGNARNYAYVDVDLLAIIGSVASAHQSAAFLGLLDDRYAALRAEFNLSDTAIWSVPCSLYPLAAPGDSAIPQVRAVRVHRAARELRRARRSRACARGRFRTTRLAAAFSERWGTRRWGGRWPGSRTRGTRRTRGSLSTGSARTARGRSSCTGTPVRARAAWVRST